MRTLALLLSALVLAGCASNTGTTTTTPSETTSTSTTSTFTTTTPTVTPPAADVVIASFKFTPSTIAKAIGAKITWRNDDTVAHTVTADDNSFDSQSIAPGATFEFTGTKDATIPYHCKFHAASMTGNLTVGAGSATTTTTTTPTTPTTPEPAKAAVSISAFMFDPSPLNIKANTNVTWTNDEVATPHSVVADDNSFKSATLSPTQTYSHVFDKTGTFTYKCGLHAFMTASVVVT